MSTTLTIVSLAIRRTLLALIALVLLQPFAFAQDTKSEADLDQLFARLKVSTNVVDANAIANQIWHIWFNPTDPELAERMREIVNVRTAFDTVRALKLLDQLVIDHPEYTEGWNRRATLHYELGNYQKSLDDIEETLAREPRHFGALAGQALVYLALSDKPHAREAAEKAREIHPYIAEGLPLSELVEPRVRL